MALLAFWKSNRNQVLELTIQQVLSNAGGGELRDGNECSMELREFLQEVPSEYLYSYTQYCLSNAFTDSGLVLQDLINEFGRRLEFDVEYGLYRGKKSAIGFDGIWRGLDIPEVIIEVKTTDNYTISLDKIAGYKKALVGNGKVGSEASLLIVVGREDTGALEAQVRGSRYAWEMRLISADRLASLLRIKEKSNEDTTVQQIQELLQPFEYTKIDKIIDVMFAATKDVEEQVDESETTVDEDDKHQVHTPRVALDAKRQEAVDAISANLGVTLVKHRAARFWSPDKSVRVCVAVSKRHARDYQSYWYAYLPAWNEFLEGGDTAFHVLACMDRDEAFAIPHHIVEENLDNLGKTVKPDGRLYWHIALTTEADGSISWNLSKVRKKIPLEDFLIPFGK